MKPFNIILGALVFIILGGFTVYKQSASSKSITSENNPVFMDVMSYIPYSEPAQENALTKGNTILFFAATNWCQTCSELDKEIIERNKEIPQDITIMKVDYDNDTEMKKTYEVTTQHTLIVLDQNGQEEKRWIGGDFDTLLQQIENI